MTTTAQLANDGPTDDCWQWIDHYQNRVIIALYLRLSGTTGGFHASTCSLSSNMIQLVGHTTHVEIDPRKTVTEAGVPKPPGACAAVPRPDAMTTGLFLTLRGSAPIRHSRMLPKEWQCCLPKVWLDALNT